MIRIFIDLKDMPFKYFITILLLTISMAAAAQVTGYKNYIQLSQDFVYAAKADGETTAYIDTFRDVDVQELAMELKTDEDKKAFFINIYNAYTQVILKKDPSKYKNRNAFFKAKQIHFAKRMISLDQLEHGILRRSRIKWSLGYFGKLFPNKFEKKFRVRKIDYRIHFSLNCGAKSCPAIAYYKPEQINEQLDLATLTYLQSEAIYDTAKKILHLPALMSWFRGDFGGKRNEKKLCRKLGIIPPNARPKIKYKSYNWNLYLDNYKK